MTLALWRCVVISLLLVIVTYALWAATSPTHVPPLPYLHYRIPLRPQYKETTLYNIYAFPLLAPETCRSWIQRIESYAVGHGGWTTKRHASYPTTDIQIKGTPLWPDISAVVKSQVFPIMAEMYGFATTELKIHDLFFVKYDAETPDAQRHLDFHRDGSLLSFNILCSDPADFDGGG